MSTSKPGCGAEEAELFGSAERLRFAHALQAGPKAGLGAHRRDEPAQGLDQGARLQVTRGELGDDQARLGQIVRCGLLDEGEPLPGRLDIGAAQRGPGRAAQRERPHEKPRVIVAYTVKGKGVSYMENNPSFHGKAPTKDQLAQALEEIAGGLK